MLFLFLMLLASNCGATQKNDHEATFTHIYVANLWGDSESISGPGSNLFQTTTIREELPQLFATLGITTLLDAPCGDFNWMKTMDLSSINYFGIDIVEEIIAYNNEHYAHATRHFAHMNIIHDQLPTVDLILCRDCLVHFSFEDALKALRNMKKSGSKYLLTTTFTSTSRKANRNIRTGDWRPINLQLPPYNLPEPILVINEKCPHSNGAYPDKSLGLWLLDDINFDNV